MHRALLASATPGGEQKITVGFDTEWVAHADQNAGKGTNSTMADTFQIAVAGSSWFVHVHKLSPDCGAVLTLFADDSIDFVVAHKGVDLAKLRARHPNVCTTNIRCIRQGIEDALQVAVLAAGVDLAGRKLEMSLCSMVDVCLGLWIDKRIDHSGWRAHTCSTLQKRHAVSDAQAHCLLAHFVDARKVDVEATSITVATDAPSHTGTVHAAASMEGVVADNSGSTTTTTASATPTFGAAVTNRGCDFSDGAVFERLRPAYPPLSDTTTAAATTATTATTPPPPQQVRRSQ